jgi:hypothetical protein
MYRKPVSPAPRLLMCLLAVVMVALPLSAAGVPAGARTSAESPRGGGCHRDGSVYRLIKGTGHEAWIRTSTSGSWYHGPARISFSRHATTTTTSVHHPTDVEGGIDYKIVSLKVSHSFGEDTTRSTTITRVWRSTLIVPRGEIARAAVFKRGFTVRVKHSWSYQRPCPVSGGSERFRVFMPRTSDRLSNYCIGLDYYPGAKITRRCGTA